MVLLPLTTLLRFKCINKHWLKLVDISLQHLCNQIPLEHFFFIGCHGGPRQKGHYFYPEPPHEEETTILLHSRSQPLYAKSRVQMVTNTYMHFSAINGLVFLADRMNNAHVFNLNTGEFMTLPSLASYKFPTAQRLGYNIGIGFGYNSVKDEYKVVATYWGRQTGQRFDFLAGVLTLGLDTSNNLHILNSWRVFSISDLGIWGISEDPIYISGTIYWLSRESVTWIDSFDMDNETFTNFLKIPEGLEEEIRCAKLMELQGRLCLIHFDAVYKEKRIDIWTMVSHEEWIKQYEIEEISRIIPEKSLRWNCIEVVSLLEVEGDGGNKLIIRPKPIPGVRGLEFFAYDLNTKTFETLYQCSSLQIAYYNYHRKDWYFSWKMLTRHEESSVQKQASNGKN